MTRWSEEETENLLKKRENIRAIFTANDIERQLYRKMFDQSYNLCVMDKIYYHYFAINIIQWKHL